MAVKRIEVASLRHRRYTEIVAHETLEDHLKRLSAPGELYEKLPDSGVRCLACGHSCKIRKGRAGVCRMRYNDNGVLRVPWGYISGLQVDPIEKKPFFHVLPGSKVLSFGMLGCDYKCPFCQNWVTSQTLRERMAGSPPEEVTPESILALARESGARVLASTYNEPLITSEWAMAVFRQARAAGMRCAYVSNGNATKKVLEYLRPCVDFYKVDLKGFDDGRYRKVMGGVLKTVLSTIERLVAMGFWVEIVTLLIPSVNDSDEELQRLAKFLASISKDIPWHVTAFHKDYQMTGPDNTPAQTLLRAAEIGRAQGLRYVYAGNLPGRVEHLEDTFCPSCKAVVIERRGFVVISNSLKLEGSKGLCKSCGTQIPGVWA